MEQELSKFKYFYYDTPTTESERFKVEIPDNKSKPTKLTKYYELNKNNVDALINHYLYASHPAQFNDPYDCNKCLLSYSKVTLEEFIDILKIQFTEDTIKYLYNNRKKDLVREYAKVLHFVTYMKLGIISFASDPLNRNMWTYYSKHDGFSVIIDALRLPQDFWGPFPLNYKDKFDKIDYEKNNLGLCTLYQTNVKSKSWESENEWRYLVGGPSVMKIPGIDYPNAHNRKFYYSLNAISEVVLGHNFIDTKELKDFDGKNYTIKLYQKTIRSRKYKRKLLTFLSQNNQIKKSWIEISDDNSFNISKRQIDIKKVSSNQFIFKYNS